MIALTVLAIIIAVFALVAAVILVTGGAAFLAVFGDLIVAIAVIVLIVKLIQKIKGGKSKN